MENVWTDITCVEDCVADACPEWGAVAIATDQDCCTTLEKSQICGIYLDPCAQNPMNGWTEADINAWSANIDNSDTTGTKIKYITVEGEIPEPTENVQELPKGKEKVVDYTYEPSFTRRCISPEMNDFMRRVQKGNTNARVWFETLGGFLYGGENGISMSKFTALPTNGGGREDVRIWTIKSKYNACVDPPRIANPLATA